ncbi:AMP-binding protein [Paraburkholderia saeva]|uniref:3-[(3aS,4S,7aS)-7a-methyl-1, 5-dioxo-octahydro-1H-inden-4-yl]propanoyl:CoA ligase n=1 Tax=Paraburkholderia saeva TaxID=2777537 RepID=A0A9N8RZJ5_9BURK|nr:AMP-binding protein [Paraburkholderia saeva]CAG4903023.1 3-[(3aS,4S,7aS)-7a-methyl-1, 5-dioxo-octahydro-1H-inden-4-yl]propanoyl:CoA ligase [Paraburkholderia saeva]CAG4908596.1 3-[(3aS,4S,7aS)-7a-methyl-1, 5-dioxo-octahydro-1H-inden-4-yl]propanoyl:CoA ligase [Paraburkholderia saeva]CAG4910495.1 3-[(3aS,4S,7aS)-7a-methyl-1, 5-dioxo-octahydro-1H-inden-4-yl]propanoyl:CoA ligase [Paraburkholderia saeva]
MASQTGGAGALIAPKDNLSYVRGSTESVLSEATVGQFLQDTARRFPERPAVVFREQRIRWTWKEFSDEVDILAAGLLALGIEKGDRVGIWSPNRVEWLLTQFATARIGAVLVNINPAYRLAELEYALNKVGCKAIISAHSFKSSMYLEMLQELAPELAVHAPGELRAERLPELRYVIRMCDTETPGMLTFSDVIEQGRASLDAARLDAIGATLSAHEPINIQFTSGTTGNPKGATLTHSNVVNNARYIAMAMRLGEDDSLCIPVPLYHCFGMVLAVLACVSVGANMVFPGEAFDPLATLTAVAEEQCTALHGVPTMFIAELDHPEFARFDLSRLRTGIMAGSPCPIETMKKVVSKMHLGEITIAYGMTETSPVSFQSSTTDPLDKRTTTVGRIQPHLEVKLVDASGDVVPVGETGELCTKGYSVMLGYWGDEAKTRESIVDGWMHTGDLATLDAEGYCNIVGRLKDMLIRGGENIYPREIEEFLFRHPKIQSVQVFGVPDPKYGEEVCAWIVLRPGEQATAQDVQEFCRNQIAHYKVPKHIRFVDELPMTVTGKVQKFVMRERMIEELKIIADKTA